MPEIVAEFDHFRERKLATLALLSKLEIGTLDVADFAHYGDFVAFEFACSKKGFKDGANQLFGIAIGVVGAGVDEIAARAKCKLQWFIVGVHAGVDAIPTKTDG